MVAGLSSTFHRETSQVAEKDPLIDRDYNASQQICEREGRMPVVNSTCNSYKTADPSTDRGQASPMPPDSRMAVGIQHRRSEPDRSSLRPLALSWHRQINF